MRRMVVRYKAKPEKAEENERLIESVFEELRANSPDGLRYLALRLADGSFVHFVASDGVGDASQLRELASFRAFLSGIKERCLEPPQAENAVIVGDYRMLGE
jgi:hypothetical protein